MDTYTKLQYIASSLTKSFPEGDYPYQMLSRLLEEGGELSEQVHIFEKSGVKEQKHGNGKPEELVKEVQDVMISVLQIAAYYGVEDILVDSIDKRFNRHSERNSKHG